MRTLHVFDTIDPASGGPVEAFRRWGGELSSAGVVCDVVSLDVPGSEVADGFPFHLTLLGEKTGALSRVMGEAFRYSSRLAPWLAEHGSGYDCVTAHGIWTYSVAGTARGLRGLDTPYLVFAHGMMDPWFRTTYPLKHLKKQLYWSIELGSAMERSAAVLFTAEEERLLARGVFLGHGDYQEKIVGLGTGDVPPPIGAQREAFSARCPQLGSRDFILFLGRIHPKKGCDLLIEAFASVAAAYPNLDLVIAGPGASDYRATLETMAARLGVAARVHWPGMLSGDAKWGAFYSALAFALSSHQENFGVAVAEALACGLPVLITRKVNIWREIVDAGAGFAGEDDAAETGAQLRRFLALRPDEQKVMRDAARTLFSARFDVRTTAYTVLDIMKQVRHRPEPGTQPDES